MGTGSNSNNTLCIIYDLTYLQMTLNIDELDIDNVEVGQMVNVTSDAKEGQTFTGVVTKVSVVGTTSGGTTTYPVTVRIDDTDGLRPGMNVDAEIVLSSADGVLAIPSLAVNRGDTVLITSDSPSAANALEQEAPEGYAYVQVTTGVSDDSYIEITSGSAGGRHRGLSAGSILRIRQHDDGRYARQRYGRRHAFRRRRNAFRRQTRRRWSGRRILNERSH